MQEFAKKLATEISLREKEKTQFVFNESEIAEVIAKHQSNEEPDYTASEEYLILKDMLVQRFLYLTKLKQQTKSTMSRHTVDIMEGVKTYIKDKITFTKQTLDSIFELNRLAFTGQMSNEHNYPKGLECAIVNAEIVGDCIELLIKSKHDISKYAVTCEHNTKTIDVIVSTWQPERKTLLLSLQNISDVNEEAIFEVSLDIEDNHLGINISS